MDLKNFRSLTNTEIEILTKNQCFSDNWDNIHVADGFIAENVKSSTFSGNIFIGALNGRKQFWGGIERNCGIYDAHIHNCKIGDQVYINHVKNYIANYEIGDHVIIDNIDLCAVDGTSSFGNGIKVEVMDETGGRKVTIYNKLSAHLAYIQAFYKHRDQLSDKIEKLIQEYSAEISSSKGIIGDHAVIANCKEIKNVNIGEYAELNGASKLENASLNSKKVAPVKIGHDVIAKNFIISTGSEISDGAIVDHCFIGQGCILSSQYSAQNSLFFANCQGFHGESCSVFAGPYTVTHHKSTLLIAGMFSFCNAGSGSNQSNHMYKLGPIHHGIVERGSKTTSDSYLLWPAKIGAFTLVMGRHYKNSDTSDMPFSYLVENKDESWLAPGVNLKSVGTIRDVMKWPRRDVRKDPEKLDCINFNLLSPFTIRKMSNGIDVLKKIKEISGETTEVFSYNNTKLRRDALKRGLELYHMAIMKFIGNSVITRLNTCQLENIDQVHKCLSPDSIVGKGKWIDLAGLIAPDEEITEMLDSVESGKISSLDKIDEVFKILHDNYYNYEWNWTFDFIAEYMGKPVNEMSLEELVSIIDQWRKSVVGIDEMLYEDAKKEFRLESMTGFGIDGDKRIKKLDFENVRGKFEDNTFVTEILDHIKRKTALGERVINQLNSVKVLN
ncbi:DUF4954 family protein [Sunxiuqinia sp. A32]|uniref:DUF4954 family protein n=1 Tax=Sunxiuqinia sp. A32 TaxID=3461496 RepID=UPI00404568D0